VLDTAQFTALTSAQFAVFQRRASRGHHIGPDGGDGKAMTLRALSTADIRALTTDALAGMGSAQLNALTNAQLIALSSTPQISSLGSDEPERADDGAVRSR